MLRRERNSDVASRFEYEIVQRGNSYVIPPVSHYEITWHLRRKNATAQSIIFNNLYADSLTKLRMEEAEFLKAADIRADLADRGLIVGVADIFIAAQCIVNGFTLVTDNTQDFENIGCGLQLVNWKK